MKLEYNSYSGLDYLPTARLAWQPNERTLFWSAVSRAVRTPSRIDRELDGGGFLAPSPDFASETLIAFEAGYRGQPTANLSLSVSAFYNIYDELRTTEPDQRRPSRLPRQRPGRRHLWGRGVGDLCGRRPGGD